MSRLREVQKNMRLLREVRIKQRLYRHIAQAASRERDRLQQVAFVLRLRAAFRKACQ